MFSVVIPTFNRAHFLSWTLDSILAQSLPSSEIIVVDDGSTDDTHSLIINHYPSVRYTRICNVGPGLARWYAASLAKQQWIAFCDSDDLWDIDHLSTIAETQKFCPEADMIVTNYCDFAETSAMACYEHFASAPSGWWDAVVERRLAAQFVMHPTPLSAFIMFNPAWPTNTAIRQELFNRVPPTLECFSRLPTEDGSLTRRLVAASRRIAGCFRITAYLRKHSGNLSSHKVSCHISRAYCLLMDLQYYGSEFDQCRELMVGAAREDLQRAVLWAFWQRDIISAGHIYLFARRFGIRLPHRYHYLAGSCLALLNWSTVHFIDPRLRALIYQIDQRVLDPLKNCANGGAFETKVR